MNTKLGAIACAGLIWLGIQTETPAQVNIRIGGSNQGVYSGGGVHGRRIYRQSTYHRSGDRSYNNRNVVIDLDGRECCDCYRQSYRNRYYNRGDYYDPYGYSNYRRQYYYIRY